MRTERDNKGVYESVEFDSWAHRHGLNYPEQFLLSTYLDPNLPTIEAGTAGGRILQELREMGFSDLSGFDYVDAMIAEAKKRDSSGKIRFHVADVRDLPFEDASFSQAIYLQQVMSMPNKKSEHEMAAREAYRILKPESTALFSFLCLETRTRDPLRRALLAWLGVVRFFSRNRASRQLMPWLRHPGLGNKNINWAALLDRPPLVYWFRIEEAWQLLASAGFTVVGCASDAQCEEDRILHSVAELEESHIQGHVYFVCKKV